LRKQLRKFEECSDSRSQVAHGNVGSGISMWSHFPACVRKATLALQPRLRVRVDADIALGTGKIELHEGVRPGNVSVVAGRQVVVRA
jgi:hypothetical protein